MANLKTREVWAGPGVLSMGRRKIAVGDSIPAELGSEARESLRKKRKIIDEVIEDAVDLVAPAVKAAEDAEKLSAEANTRLGEIATAVTEAGQAISDVKGDAKKAAQQTLKTLEAEKSAAETAAANLAENAVRLRMEADRVIAAAE